MLAVILHVTLDLLKEGPPDNRDSTLGGILANILMKVYTHTHCYNLYEYVRIFNLYCFYAYIDSVGVLPASVHGVLCCSPAVG
jgi:hypothetical protein